MSLLASISAIGAVSWILLAMNRTEALGILGLPPNPTEAAVDDAFRRCALDTHPDRGGDAAEFQRICAARDVLLGHDEGGSLVPIREVRDLLAVAMNGVAARDRKEELREETRRVVRGMARIRTTRLRALRDRSAIATLVGALAAAASQVLRLVPTNNSSFPWETLANSLALFFGSAAFLAAVGLALCAYRVSAIQSSVTDLDQTLDDRSIVVRILREVLTEAELRPPVALERWFDAVEEWSDADVTRYRSTSPRAYARRLGSADFARLLYAKAKEQQVVVEQDTWIDDELVVSFDFNRPAE